MLRQLTAAAFAALALACAQAETADRSKPLTISANSFRGDEVTQKAVYSGAVEVRQGTLEILGDRLELVVRPDGYRMITVTGSPVRMKQRNDVRASGVEEWIHASAERAVYDEREDAVSLEGQARIDRRENGVTRDSASGGRILYNLRTARSRVEGATVDGHRSRVTTVLSPRAKTAPSKAPSPDLESASRIQH